MWIKDTEASEILHAVKGENAAVLRHSGYATARGIKGARQGLVGPWLATTS